MSTVLLASGRLALSRERLHQAMRNRSPAPDTSATQHGGESLLARLNSLRAIPGASIIIDSVTDWWAQHPLRVAGTVAADAARTVVQPLAQRNPVGMVVGALLLGGMLGWSRPWRWVITPALAAGLLPQILSSVANQMSNQSWMSILTSLARQPGRSD